MQSSNDRLGSTGGGPRSAVDQHAVPGRAYVETPPGSHHDGPYQDDPRYDDPWYDALASGWGESAGAGALEEVQPPRPREPVGEEPPRAAADVYLEVQRSEAFQEVRSRYRRFVVPAGAAFFVWYIAYVVTATTAPALMARPVAGAVNVGMLAGIGQFLTTFLLTWAYARHARLRRDRAALELRWDTQELTRGARGGAS
ncbi:DUF485 domain-containing protein [Streptomyces olivaceus]|uniref:DUF485 domain-containing protein n=1 Tax=Streptomyces TaxID=1883 RepID=UPI0008782186|nr:MULTISPECIES: DUF485 domain-containing protein [Streptomyces]AOW91415.1 hypothetical protein BC342_26365 [Streptomyces olivaceus]MBZ6197419.1 DUF485 domain-containing protein [Streptomyces olivaceus]MCC2270032.1 DUF485 domain-containing protein [Streptomyces sp. CT1-17]QIP73070.1 DUF485 domain-containing protein [Streptomyces sp. VN1]